MLRNGLLFRRKKDYHSGAYTIYDYTDPNRRLEYVVPGNQQIWDFHEESKRLLVTQSISDEEGGYALLVFDTKTSQRLAVLSRRTHVEWAFFDSTGQRVVTVQTEKGGNGRKLVMYEIAKPEAAFEVGIPQGRIETVRLGEDGKAYLRLNTGSNTDEIYVLEGKQLIKLRDFDGTQKVFLGSKYLTIDQGTSKLVFRDIRDDRDILVSKFELARGFPDIFGLRGDWMVLVNARGEVERWNLRTGQRDIILVDQIEPSYLAMNKSGNIVMLKYETLVGGVYYEALHVK